ncbi:MAG: excinuclease ABC subunit UvrC [Gammaproteobacteria bacterium]|nr:MAG: excinuclease ABC subunit UvrC [Gammaproteobacteria bacterium]
MDDSLFEPKQFLNSVSTQPGVYRMLDAAGKLLYIGKAQNLRKRLASYFTRANDNRTQLLVSQIHDIEVTTTRSEGEALLLENTLIKQLKPRYNVLLRDDKSFPYISLSTDEPFARIACTRGARKGAGRYFGPYPSAAAVRVSLNLLQKVFKLRTCEDYEYKNRSRPCLQYQLKRCTAPCVGFIPEEDYKRDVNNVAMFLEGKSNEVIDSLAQQMDRASEHLEFEHAAGLRDQIASLRRMQEKFGTHTSLKNLDVIAGCIDDGHACIQVFYIRHGINLGGKTYFPHIPAQTVSSGMMNAFISQYYLKHEPPPEIIVSIEPDDSITLEGMFSEQYGRRIHIRHGVRGVRARLLDDAIRNAQQSLNLKSAASSRLKARFEALRDAFNMDAAPNRIECFDISHTSGTKTVASCVVFGQEGPKKSDYRRFNIKDITPGDDYAAMTQALMRRYKRIKRGEEKLPDVLLVDGGRGQLSHALAVFDQLDINGVFTVGVAKGAGRKPGLEKLFLADTKNPVLLPPDSPALLLIQQIRDEAHRFAITGHRQRRKRGAQTSVLEGITGLGPKKRQRLLKQFGGLREIARTGIDELVKVPGINRALAERIFATFHPETG